MRLAGMESDLGIRVAGVRKPLTPLVDLIDDASRRRCPLRFGVSCVAAEAEPGREELETLLSIPGTCLHISGPTFLQLFCQEGALPPERVPPVRRVQLNMGAPSRFRGRYENQIAAWFPGHADQSGSLDDLAAKLATAGLDEIVLQVCPTRACTFAPWQQSLANKLRRHGSARRIGLLFDVRRTGDTSLWPAPVAGFDTGYAGRLHAGNIEEALRVLERHTADPTWDQDGDIWVEMERGARDANGRLDIEGAIVPFIDAVAGFHAPSARAPSPARGPGPSPSRLAGP